jgi:hypothetical protein
VEVSAEKGRAVQRVRIEFPAGYLRRFDEIRSFPQGANLTSGGYEYTLPVSPDGAAAPVFVDLMPAEYGWARGSVRIVVNDREASLPLETFVFP